jgi:FkbM family methyltransferase
MMNYGSLIENELFWRGYAGSWERASLALWRDLVPDAGYILDVGANTGTFALAAQALNPTAKVLAIEASPRVFNKLISNIKLNGFPIIASGVAASDKSGSAIFYDFDGEHQYSASLEAGMGGTLLRRVPTACLDDLLEAHGFPAVDLMKLDVELHEPAVLRGMRRFIQRHPPMILLEVLSDDVERGVRHALDGVRYDWTRIADPEGRNFLLTPR